jgi:hypothetical protein
MPKGFARLMPITSVGFETGTVFPESLSFLYLFVLLLNYFLLKPNFLREKGRFFQTVPVPFKVA